MDNGDPAAAKEAPLRPITLEEELRKNPQLKEQDVALLRDWVSMQPHLPSLFDRELALVMHLSNYSVNRAKEIADIFFTLRTHLPEVFSQRDPTHTDLRIAASISLCAILPKTTLEGYDVFVQRLMTNDTTNYSFTDLLKLVTMAIELWFLRGTSPGLVIVIDFQELTLWHLAQVSISVLKKFFIVQEVIKNTVKGIHYINAPILMDSIVGMTRPFLKKDISDMLYVHTSLETFYKYVPQNILPKEYGGSISSLKKLQERMQSQLLANREYFLAEEERRVDEQKRPGRPYNVEDLFGVEGTFRKLDID